MPGLAEAVVLGNKLYGAAKQIKGGIDRTQKGLGKFYNPKTPTKKFKKKVATTPKAPKPITPSVPDGVKDAARNNSPFPAAPKKIRKKDINMPKIPSKKPGGNILSPDAVRKLGEMGFRP